MGSFVVSGLPQAAVERLKKRWHLKEGDIFDQTTAADFMKKDALPAVQGSLTPSSKIKMVTPGDRQRHIVNVTIQVE
jgi:hypothetical protein